MNVTQAGWGWADGPPVAYNNWNESKLAKNESGFFTNEPNNHHDAGSAGHCMKLLDRSRPDGMIGKWNDQACFVRQAFAWKKAM